MKRTNNSRKQFSEESYISTETKDLKTAYRSTANLAKYHLLAMHCLNFKLKKIGKKKRAYLQGRGSAGKRKKSRTILTRPSKAPKPSRTSQ